MPLHRRHGLRTVTLNGDGATGRRQVAQVLEGRKTVILRPLRGPEGSAVPLERPGELILAVDHNGRSFAVLRVERVGVILLADVDEALCRAEAPEVEDPVLRSAGQRRKWLAARLRVGEHSPVVWISFHVVGREEES